MSLLCLTHFSLMAVLTPTAALAALDQSIGLSGAEVVLHSGRADVLSRAPALEDLAERSAQPGAMHGLAYLLDQEYAARKLPHLVLFFAPDQHGRRHLLGSVLLFEYRAGPWKTGLISTGDSVGVRTVIGPEALRPSLEAVPVNLGPQPALFLAIEDLPASLLNRHGIFFELGPGTYAVEHALSHEPWWLFGEDGELGGEGLLRPQCVGGVWKLAFQVAAAAEKTDDTGAPKMPEGFYSGRQFLFPAMTEGQPFLCRAPRLLEPVLAKMVGRDAGTLLARPRVWIKIPMPPGVPALHHAINGILLHTMTCSNVFVRNQTLQFARDGVSVPVTRAGGTPEHLVAPISVMSVDNEAYLAGNRPGAKASVGRYEMTNGRLTVHPGSHADGTRHSAANVRLWLTNGTLGNRVGPGDITGFANVAALAGVRIAPVTAASGGSDGEEMASEERRFADALLTRGRIVTKADLETAALAIDRRILRAESSSGLQRREGGMRRVERLQVTLDSHGFSKPEVELPALKSQMEGALGERLVQGLLLEVSFSWS